MCGIAVVISKNKTAYHYADIMRQMLTKMNHRGPDGQGEFVSEEIVLGMVRLAIVDHDGGQQPLWNEDKSICVFANGEIYNYSALRESLIRKGHHFQSLSDVEVLVHLYEEYGVQFLEHIQGIYAFAVWDLKQNRLMVARDRTGVKPLYWMETKDAILFSSEMNALLSMPLKPYRMDLNALSEYHGLRFVTAPRSIINGINKLPPAHWALITNGLMTVQKYWKPQTAAATVGSASSARQLLDLIQRAVISQEAPEVKSGLFLSGGIDSSALIALQTSNYQMQPLTLTVGFDKPAELASVQEYDELREAQRTADIFDAEHVSKRYSAEEVLSELPQIVAALDEPVADPTAIPLWFVSRMAKDAGCKVVYSGEGLDEIFYGYSVYSHADWLQFFGKLPAGARKFALKWIEKWRLPGKGLLNRSLRPISEWYQGIGGAFTPQEKRGLFSSMALEQLPSDEAVFPNRGFSEHPSRSILKKMADFDFQAWLPDNTLAKSDKISMANSLELRVPYLDHPIIEFAEQLPVHLKRRGKVGKLAVREAFQKILPQEIINRPKIGFPVPITAWIFGEWRDFVGDILLNNGSYTRELYNRSEIEKLLHGHYPMRRGRAGRLLWTLLTLELWMRAHPQVSMGFEAKDRLKLYQ
jgi:asparagine synthase (glutamine-hydrolysing)